MRLRNAAALSSLTLLSSCAAGPAPGPKSLLPTVSIEFGEITAFADLVEARVTVSNTTIEPILVEAVELEGQLPWFHGGPVSLSGGLRERRNEYLHDPEAPGVTAPVFTGDWLLLPAEARTVSERCRARFARQKVRLFFRRLPVEELCEEGYFPVPDQLRKKTTRYRRISQSRLNDYRRIEPGSPERLFILPAEESWPVETAETTLEVSVPAPPDVEDLGASARAALTRWQTEKSWIVDDPAARKTFGMDEEGSRFDLPRCDLLVFDVLDLSPPDEPIPVYREGSEEPVDNIFPPGARFLLDRALSEGRRLHPAWTKTEDGRYQYGLLEK